MVESFFSIAWTSKLSLIHEQKMCNNKNESLQILQTPRLCNVHDFVQPHRETKRIPFSSVATHNLRSYFYCSFNLRTDTKNGYALKIDGNQETVTRPQCQWCAPTRKRKFNIFLIQKIEWIEFDVGEKCWENIMLAPMSRSTWLCTMERSTFKNRSHRLRVQHLFIYSFVSILCECPVLSCCRRARTQPNPWHPRVCVSDRFLLKTNFLLFKMVRSICHFLLVFIYWIIVLVQCVRIDSINMCYKSAPK